MIDREAIVAAARACCGTKVVHQGRRPGIGLDCGGLVLAAAAVPGLEPITLEANYSKTRMVGLRLYRTLRRLGDEIPLAAVQGGSVLVFWMTTRAPGRSPIAQHVAVSTGSGLIHADTTAGRVAEVHWGPFWADRLFAAFDFREAGAGANHLVPERCVDCTDLEPCRCG